MRSGGCKPDDTPFVDVLPACHGGLISCRRSRIFSKHEKKLFIYESLRFDMYNLLIFP